MTIITNQPSRETQGLEEPRAQLLRSAAPALGGTFIVGLLATIYLDPLALRAGAGYLLALAALSVGTVLLLAERHRQLAHLLWQLATTVLITATAAWTNTPTWLFLLAILPLLAVLSQEGWLTLSAMILAVSGFWYGQNMLTTTDSVAGSIISPESALPFGALLFSVLMVAWRAARAGQTFVLWYRQSYELARANMEQARDQRLELKQIEEDLIASNQQLTTMSRRLQALTAAAEEARRAKEDFVAVVSHELRTPLNMIIGFSEVIVQSPEIYGGTLPPALMADIASIRRNSAHLLELINDVLDLSQVDMGKLSIAPRWTSATELVHSATDVVRPLYASKGLALESGITLDDDEVFCDPTRMREVLVNLLSNAGRFTEAGSVCITLTKVEGQLRFAVRDTGPGIAPEKQAQLFEPFHQLDPTMRQNFGGSGLGLAISKRFVELHEGRMWLESAVGAGTTIFFSLPSREAPTDRSTQSPLRWINAYSPYVERTRRNMAPATAPAQRVVVVEEQDAVLTRLLRRHLPHFEISHAPTLDAGVESLRAAPVELLLINAPDAEQQLARLGSRLQTLYGTPLIACWTPGLHEAADRLGVLRYLVKPVSRAKLLGALGEIQPAVESVLIVDDNAEVLQLFGRILATADPPYRVLRADGGERALRLLRTRGADAIILDLVMQEMSGYQVLKALALDPALCDIPVLVVSSQNPTDQHAVCDAVHVSLAGGLTAGAFLSLLTAVQEALSPHHATAAQTSDVQVSNGQTS